MLHRPKWAPACLHGVVALRKSSVWLAVERENGRLFQGQKDALYIKFLMWEKCWSNFNVISAIEKQVLPDYAELKAKNRFDITMKFWNETPSLSID